MFNLWDKSNILGLLCIICCNTKTFDKHIVEFFLFCFFVCFQSIASFVWFYFLFYTNLTTQSVHPFILFQSLFQGYVMETAEYREMSRRPSQWHYPAHAKVFFESFMWFLRPQSAQNISKRWCTESILIRLSNHSFWSRETVASLQAPHGWPSFSADLWSYSQPPCTGNSCKLLVFWVLVLSATSQILWWGMRAGA